MIKWLLKDRPLEWYSIEILNSHDGRFLRPSPKGSSPFVYRIAHIARNVPASSLQEACEKVAKNRGLEWLGSIGDDEESFYVVDRDSYDEWYGDDSVLDSTIADLRNGKVAICRGLLVMKSMTVSIEDWDE